MNVLRVSLKSYPDTIGALGDVKTFLNSLQE